MILPNGATLAPGAPATTVADGTVMSMLADGGGLVVNGSTIALAMPTPTGPEVLTIAGETMTAGPGDLFFDGSTLVAGGAAATIGGTRVSLDSSEVVVGTSTVPLPQRTGLGGVILSGFGNIGVAPTVVATGGAGGNGTGVTEFIGGGARARRRVEGWGWGVVGVVGVGLGLGAFVL